MDLEFSVAIATVAMSAAFVIDWPRAVLGLLLGALCRFLPYGTIVVPAGVILVSALTEVVEPLVGRTLEQHLWGFALGLFAVAGTASSLFITVRNVRDRL